MSKNDVGDGLFNDPNRDDRAGEQQPAGGADGGQLTQGDQRPWIGVHVLSQFVFCPRSGVITHEQDAEDSGEIERPRVPRLDSMRDYQAALLEEALEGVRQELSKVAIGASLWGLALGVIAVAIDPVLAGLLLLPAVVFVPLLKRRLGVYLDLRRRLWLANHANPRMPAPNMPANQLINWWQLLQAGCEASKPREPYQDKNLRLTGKPYLILTNKGQRLPVIRKWKGKEQLHAKDYARCAAYAHLIKTRERATVPFAIILFGDKYDGVAVPITAKAEALFRRGLADAQKTLRRLAEGDSRVSKPVRLTFCSGCQFGRPREYVADESETVLAGTELWPQCTIARNTLEYHCTCQDRFNDGVPPHARAITLGLIE